jgi:DNA-binding NarL/FixJ family response regulator
VFIVDDHRSFAEAVALTIDSQPDMECIGIARSAEEALVEIDRKLPRIVLLDLGLPGKSGIEALVEIKRRQPDMRVLLISGAVSPDALVEAANEGADGYVHKEASLHAVIGALRSAGDMVVADVRILTALSRTALPTPPDEFGLTARELEVLVLLADGVATKLIARQLGITLNTCRGYVRSILLKLNAHSQLSAVVKAAQFGLLPRLRA